MVEATLENYGNLRFLVKYMLGHHGYIAGGCFKNIFLNEKIKDIDMFFESESDFVMAKKYFESKKDEYVYFYENKKVYAFKEKSTGIAIELIRHKYAAPEKMLGEFDFTVSKFCLYTDVVEDGDGETSLENKILFHPQFFEHLMFKRTVVDDKLLYPASTLERIIKYTKYGFYPCRETKAKLLKEIREAEIVGDLAASLYDGVD